MPAPPDLPGCQGDGAAFRSVADPGPLLALCDASRRPIPEAEVRSAMGPGGDEAGWSAGGRLARPRHDLGPALHVAAALVCAAAGWYLLKELGPLLRPLTLAVFLAYTILPVHRSLSRRVPARVAGPLLALLVAAVVLGLAMLVYGNLVDLKAELPRLIERSRGMIERLRTWGRDHLPAWATRPGSGRGPGRGGDRRAGSRPWLPVWSTPRPASWPRPWSSCSICSSSCSWRIVFPRGSGPDSARTG